VFELKRAAAFEAANFTALFESRGRRSAATWSRNRVHLRPGEIRHYDRSGGPKVATLGLAAAFRTPEKTAGDWSCLLRRACTTCYDRLRQQPDPGAVCTRQVGRPLKRPTDDRSDSMPITPSPGPIDPDTDTMFGTRISVRPIRAGFIQAARRGCRIGPQPLIAEADALLALVPQLRSSAQISDLAQLRPDGRPAESVRRASAPARRRPGQGQKAHFVRAG